MMLKDTLDTLELDPRRRRGSGYLMRRTEFVLQTRLCQGVLPCLDWRFMFHILSYDINAEHLIQVSSCNLALADYPATKLCAESSKLPAIKRLEDFHVFGNQLGKTNIHSANMKLKECSLTMSREYYRSKKSVKNIFDVSVWLMYDIPLSTTFILQIAVTILFCISLLNSCWTLSFVKSSATKSFVLTWRHLSWGTGEWKLNKVVRGKRRKYSYMA